jgi:hypothetical protein
MICHPEGTEKLIDTREQRRKERADRIQHDPKIMGAIRRDQRPKNKPTEHAHSSRRQKVA